MTTLGGNTGLLSDKAWLLVENKAIREMYQAERERRRVAEEQFRLIERRLEMANENQ